MDRNKVKMAAAVTLLFGALALLTMQIVGRRQVVTRSSGHAAPEAVMEPGDESALAAVQTVAWQPPTEGLDDALRANPFLPVKASSRMAAAVSGGRKRGTRSFRVVGIRTGSPKTAIINDRILAEGETVSGWRVQRIERNRVILKNSEGRTIQLAAK